MIRFAKTASRREKSLFFEAFLLQFRYKILLLFFPLRTYKDWFELKKTASEKDYTIELIEIRTAVLRVSKLMNWSNSCLVMSLCAKRMLNARRIPSQLHLGLQLNAQKKMQAHAWIEAGNTEIVAKDGNYTVMFTI